MSKNRGFEVISCLNNMIPLPERKTSHSAGYDISVIHPDVFELLKQGKSLNEAWLQVSHVLPEDKTKRFATVWKGLEEHAKAIMLPTGIKAYMQDDEYLSMTIRSSAGIKEGLKQANPTSIIDCDYYNNPDNEGHIMFAVSNDFIIFDEPIMRIAQGVFLPYLVADNDNTSDERTGGIGSTGK